MEQTSIKRFRPHPLYILSNPVALPVQPAAAAGEGPLLCGHHQLFADRGLSAGGEHLQLAAGRVGGRAVAAGHFCRWGVLLWATFVVELTADGLLVRRGRFPAGGELPAGLPILTCVSLVAPLRLRVFGAQYLRVDTAGGESYAGRPCW